MVCFARLKNHCFNGVYLLTKFVAVGGVCCGAVGCVISAELPDKLTAWRRGKGNHKKDDIWSMDVGKIREREVGKGK